MLLALPPCGNAAEVVFSAQIDGVRRSFPAECVYIQGLPHVDLASLVRAVGGDCRVRPTQVQVDLRKNTALVGLNSNQVHASLKGFSLRHPIVQREDRVYVELLDVQTFFSEAFNIALAPSFSIGAERPAEPPDPTGRPVTTELPAPVPAPAPGPRSGSESMTALEPLDTSLFDTASRPESAPALEPFETAATVPDAADDEVTRIILDPGHGGKDPGNVGERGTTEKDVALALALALRRTLEEKPGFTVHLTREDDSEASSRMRATFANAQRGDLLLSIHTGASVAPQAHGIMAFCPPPINVADAALDRTRPNASLGNLDAETAKSRESRRLAEAILSGIQSQTSTETLGIRETPMQVIRQSTMPGVLLEVGFLSNPAEEALLATDAYLAKLAAGIAQGIATGLHEVGQP